jgi:hypothetical protein
MASRAMLVDQALAEAEVAFKRWGQVASAAFLSGTNPSTIIALAFGAILVASAMFLILDLTEPYSGLFRVPASSLEQAIGAIGK